MERYRVTAYIKSTAAVALWGASFVATKVALRDVSPPTIVWLRFAIGALVLGIVVVVRRQFSLPEGKEWSYFALLGLSGIAFHQWLQSTGLITSKASTTAWIVATIPIFIALLGWLVLKEKLSWAGVTGIILATVGVLLVVTDGDLASLTAGHFGAPGDILIMISAPNWAIYSVLSRRVMGGGEGHNDVDRRPAARMTFWVMSIGWVFTSLQLFAGPGISEIKELTTDGWLGIGFLGVFCSGLGYIYWQDALEAIPASQVGAFLYLEPLVTVVVAAAVLGEPITLASLLGGSVILLGVWMVSRPASKPLEDRKASRGPEA
jgi:drug/metabolite transporter (DMT)-like permease